MKKLFAIMLALIMMLSLAACGGGADPTTPSTPSTPSEPSTPASTAMTFAEYMAAADDAAVEVECYVQATQSWWDNKIVIYAQDKDGGYFAYNVTCTQEEAEKLVPGTKINLKGFKTSYKDMPEIAEGATLTILEGADSYIADPVDMTNLLGKQELVNKAGMKAAFKGLTISSISYKNDEPGDDIYVGLTLGENTFDFCVEVYLTGTETDVYKAFETLAVGDVVDVEGFVYWYDADEDGESGDGINTHITAISKAN